MSEADPEGLGDTLRILIATDLHVGFKEREAIRGEDSFLALEEVLQTAKAQKVRHFRIFPMFA
jgi:double-strand break repair protein MRE11